MIFKIPTFYDIAQAERRISSIKVKETPIFYDITQATRGISSNIMKEILRTRTWKLLVHPGLRASAAVVWERKRASLMG